MDSGGGTPTAEVRSMGSISDWFAANAAGASPVLESLLKYSAFGDDDDYVREETFGSPFQDKDSKSTLDSSALHFSLNRLSFNPSQPGGTLLDESSSSESSPTQTVTALTRGRRPQRETPGENSRERSKKYSQSLRKESARKTQQLPQRKGANFSTSLPKLAGLGDKNGKSKLEGGLDKANLDLLGLSMDESLLKKGLESLGEDEASSFKLQVGRDRSQSASISGVTPTVSGLARRSSFSRRLSSNNRIVPDSSIMTGVIPGSQENSQVWSVDSSENTPDKSLLTLKVTTPPQSSLEPWLKNEAKRENEALISGFEEDLRYKIRALAVEYDRLQFRALECEDVITTQKATVKLKTKMHKKDLAQRDKLLSREAAIRKAIRTQEDKLVILARRLVFKHILQRVAKLHVETYKKVQVEEKKVEKIALECEIAKKEQVKIKTSVNAAKIEKFKWLARHEEEKKRKAKMIAFRRGELSKLKNQSKKLGLVTDSQIITSNFLGLINTVQNAGMEKEAVDSAEDVDKTANTMMQLHKLYKVTNTTNADEVISVWNRSVEGLESMKSNRDARMKHLETLRANKLALQEDLELLHLTGKGIFMEKNQEVRHITLQGHLDNALKELSIKSKSLNKVSMELRIIYQGILNMLKKMKAHAPELPLNCLSEAVMSSLKHPINLEHAGSMPHDVDVQDVSILFKNFEESLVSVNKLVANMGAKEQS